MIKSYKGKTAKKIANNEAVKGISQDLARSAQRKLTILENAKELSDLASPPGNNLEELKGDRKGQHSIRINDKWRICFVWNEGNAEDVEIVDYH